MKIWKGYGTEHSANLVIIGKFKNESDAQNAEELISELTDIVRLDEEEGKINAGESYNQFSDRIMDFCRNKNFASMDYNDPEALLYNYDISQFDNTVEIHTEEQKFQIFLNILIHKGAKIELFSAHDYDSKYSRH